MTGVLFIGRLKQTNGEHLQLDQKWECQVSEEYDVVIDVLQKHHDKLWDMSKNKDEWGIMDHIRLEQMEQLKKAMKLWKEQTKENNEQRTMVKICLVAMREG